MENEHTTTEDINLQLENNSPHDSSFIPRNDDIDDNSTEDLEENVLQSGENNEFASTDYDGTLIDSADALNEPQTGENGSSLDIPVPSLRGNFVVDNKGIHVCRGLWAMSDTLHDVPGQTSEFEFKCTPPNGGTTTFPYSGAYKGWFMLQQVLPRPSIKVEDREIHLRFEKVGDNYKVHGEGRNNFGKFSLSGILSADHSVHLYKQYIPRPVSSSKSRKSSSKKEPHQSSASVTVSHHVAKKENLSTTAIKPKIQKPLPPPPILIPDTPRNRRPSVLMNSSDVDAVEYMPQPPPSSTTSATTAPTIQPGSTQASKEARIQRPSSNMLRCLDILKDLSKQPQAMWFNEPVDYIKLNIPDYPTIIKEPMDFRTIRLNLERNAYKSPEEFAENVRLTFRNAITYNSLRDNPVHIAAREMSNRFEEKYRIMMSQLGSVPGVPGDYETSPRGIQSKKSKKVSTGQTKRTSLGPRTLDSVATAPAVMEDKNSMIMDLQRKITEMQSEITQLRSVVTKEPKAQGQTKKKTTIPLSLEEKRALIAQIYKLPPDRMSRVVDLIQSALPPTDRADGDDEVEISLDEVDTATLRKLQDYVQSIPGVGGAAVKKRKRPQTPAAGSKPIVKRSKKKSDAPSAGGTSSYSVQSDPTGANGVGPDTELTFFSGSFIDDDDVDIGAYSDSAEGEDDEAKSLSSSAKVMEE